MAISKIAWNSDIKTANFKWLLLPLHIVLPRHLSRYAQNSQEHGDQRGTTSRVKDIIAGIVGRVGVLLLSIVFVVILIIRRNR